MIWIKRVLYGMLIGIASIAPGISGGTIAIALGFYWDLIEAISDLLKHFKKNFLFLLPFGIGGLISIGGLSVVIQYLFTHHIFPTTALFIGFIVGTLPFILKTGISHLGQGHIKWTHWVTMIAFAVIVMAPSFFTGNGGHSVVLSHSAGSIALLILTGIISAATLIIPGLSGTVILTAMGLYLPLLKVASTFVTAAVSLDWPAIQSQLIYLFPLGGGLIAGIFLAAKLVRFLFQKAPSYVYAAISGLIVATPVIMIKDLPFAQLNWTQGVLSIASLIIGYIIVIKLGDKN